MKVLVSDFDKTLYTEDYLKNIERINKFVDDGNMFIIATGRNIEQLKKDIVDYNINYSYLICNDGGIIVDKFDNVVFQKNISDDIAKSLYEYLKTLSNISSVYIDDGFRFDTEYKTGANAVLARFNERDEALDIIEHINDNFDNVTTYTSLVWINSVNDEASKGNAIKYLTDLLNIKKDNIFTVGDGINDVSMISMFKGYYMESDSCNEVIEVSTGSVKRVMDLIDIIEKD